MSTMPARSLEQRRSALQRANESRFARAQRKRLWRDGTQDEAVADFLDLVESTPDWASTWKVAEALRWLPKFGTVKIGRIMAQARCSLAKTLGGLTQRQRSALRTAVQEHTAGHPVRQGLDRCPECGEWKSQNAALCERCRWPGTRRGA